MPWPGNFLLSWLTLHVFSNSFTQVAQTIYQAIAVELVTLLNETFCGLISTAHCSSNAWVTCALF